MKTGRPRKLRMMKSAKRKYGAARRGAKSPAQIAATVGRRRVRRTKGK